VSRDFGAVAGLGVGVRRAALLTSLCLVLLALAPAAAQALPRGFFGIGKLFPFPSAQDSKPSNRRATNTSPPPSGQPELGE